jgi:hypothetical protein
VRYQQAELLDAARFRRLVGVQKDTFKRIVEVLADAKAKLHWHGGRKTKLDIGDIALMTLMYLRENRTYFHISQSFGLAESTCWTTIRWAENTLIQSRAFRLPGKKELLKDGVEFAVVLMDATETPIERPKKTTPALFGQEKAPHPEIPACR